MDDQEKFDDTLLKGLIVVCYYDWYTNNLFKFDFVHFLYQDSNIEI